MNSVFSAVGQSNIKRFSIAASKVIIVLVIVAI